MIIVYFALLLTPIVFDIYNYINPHSNWLYNTCNIYLEITYHIFIKPLYLLIISLIFVSLKKLDYKRCLISMLAIIFIGLVINLIFNKVHCGYYWGYDTPGGAYLAVYGIPCIIIILGIIIAHMCKTTRKDVLMYYMVLLIPTVADLILMIFGSKYIATLSNNIVFTIYKLVIKPLFFFAVSLRYLMFHKANYRFIFKCILSATAIDTLAIILVYETLPIYFISHNVNVVRYTFETMIQCLIIGFGTKVLFGVKKHFL